MAQQHRMMRRRRRASRRRGCCGCCCFQRPLLAATATLFAGSFAMHVILLSQHVGSKSPELLRRDNDKVNRSAAARLRTPSRKRLASPFEPAPLSNATKRLEWRRKCKNTADGRHYLADDQGFACSRFEINDQTGCCGPRAKRFSCHTCSNSTKCCSVYEYCVACCTAHEKFEHCRTRCRTSSRILHHMNEYRSERRYCFAPPLR